MTETIVLDWTWEHGPGPMIQQDIRVEIEVSGGTAEVRHVGSYAIIHRTSTMLKSMPAGTQMLESRNIWLPDTDPLASIIIADLNGDEKLIERALEEAAERAAEYRAEDRRERGWARRFA